MKPGLLNIRSSAHYPKVVRTILERIMHFKLHIDPLIHRLYPGYIALVIYADGLINGPSNSYTTELLRATEIRTRDLGPQVLLDNHPHIQAWRQAFKTFGAKPKRHFCGAEALMRRVLQGGTLPEINRVVDAYNCVSLAHVIPVGGEDRDKLTSDLRLMTATGTEPFVTGAAGQEETTSPSKGEVIWKDSEGVTVRRWNWRQCSRTLVQVNTTSAYFVLDALPPFGAQELISAAKELMSHLRNLSPGVNLDYEILKDRVQDTESW
jgi:DNA/RNA-binding domain of Phe-tRNA-synthetase-like protein